MGSVFPGVSLKPPPVMLAAPKGPVTIGAGYQKVVPETLLVNTIFIGRPLQIVCVGVVVTVAVGLTVMVNVCTGPSQVTEPFVK